MCSIHLLLVCQLHDVPPTFGVTVRDVERAGASDAARIFFERVNLSDEAGEATPCRLFRAR